MSGAAPDPALWGIVATIKAPLPQVEAFVAHHRGLNPAHIWLFFDDPDDPAAEAMTGLAGVTVIRCDRAHWKRVLGKRPAEHQVRQTMNVRSVYNATGLDWIAHIDVDEFLILERSLDGPLSDPDRAIVKVEAWDALHDPGAAGGVFASRYFVRGLRRGEDPALLQQFYGDYARLIPKGKIGHVAGKCFFRTGIEGFKPSIHGARFLDRPFPTGAAEPGLALLHFHAEDPARWLGRLSYRLDHGAYRAMPEMQAFLRAATPEAREAFYRAVQEAGPELLSRLRPAGFLRQHDLALGAKVAALRAGA